MKIKNLFVAMLAGAAMVSCSNEDFESGVNNGAIQAGETNFVSVNIMAPSATRATGDFVDGDPEESAVSKAVFLFLDGNYNGCANPFTINRADTLDWVTSVIDGQTNVALQKGDKVIIVTYVSLTEDEIKTHNPKIVIVDDNNKIV